MYELLSANPWLVAVVVGGFVGVACTALVTITEYLQKSHQAEVDASLKHAMLERGLSANEISQILSATGDRDEIHRSAKDEGVRLGCGDFQLEVGSLSRRTADYGERQPTT